MPVAAITCCIPDLMSSGASSEPRQATAPQTWGHTMTHMAALLAISDPSPPGGRKNDRHASLIEKSQIFLAVRLPIVALGAASLPRLSI